MLDNDWKVKRGLKTAELVGNMCSMSDFLSGSVVKNPPKMQEKQVQSLGQEDPRVQEMATHSSILAWEIPGTEEPGELQFIKLQKSWTWLSS